MRKYYISLIVVTLILVIASFVVLWVSPTHFTTVMPLLALYFAIVTGVQHYLIARSTEKDPRAFIRSFLGISVGALALHLIVIIATMLTHLPLAKEIAISFMIGYATFLIFETTELVLFVKKARNQND